MAEKRTIRLDKYLSDMGAGSRFDVKKKIGWGRVKVNGKVVFKPEYRVTVGEDTVVCDKKTIVYESFVYFMMNKPSGVICACEDDNRETVLDLITDRTRKDLFPAGRLDKDTVGLLLITNDGQLSHALLSPKKHVDKTYEAIVRGDIGPEDIKAFSEGIKTGGDEAFLPADLEIIKSGMSYEEMLSVSKNWGVSGSGETGCDDLYTRVRIVIREGKYHEIKRMFESVGKEVVSLKRTGMGPLKLDETLKPGQYRPLTEDEIRSLLSSKDSVNNVNLQPKKHADPENDEDRLLQDADAVLFDVDGTLMDSMGLWREVDIRYLARHNIEMPENLQRDIAGLSIIQTADYFRNVIGIDDPPEQMLKEWNELAVYQYKNEVKLKPGAKRWLEELSARGIPCAVGTSNTKLLAMTALESCNIRQFFKVILTGEDISRGKPDPFIYSECAKRLGVKESRCLVFEDISEGIRSGLSAGMKVCAVWDDFSSYQMDEKKSLAHCYIDSFDDIFDNRVKWLRPFIP